MLRKFKLGMRLGMSYSLLTIILIGLIVFTMTKISELSHSIDLVVNDRMVKTRQANDLIEHVNQTARSMRNIFLMSDATKIANEREVIKNAAKDITGLLDSMTETIKSEEGVKRLEAVKKDREEFIALRDEMFKKFDQGQKDAAIADLMGAVRANQLAYMKSINELINFQTDLANKDGEEAKSISEALNKTLIILGAVAVLLTVLIAVFMTRSITVPLRKASDVADQVAEGKTDMKIEVGATDEVGQLMNSMEKMVANINLLIAEMKEMSKQHDLGEIDVMVNSAKFSGAFKEMGEGVNNMVNGHIAVKKKAMACVGEFGQGNFDAPLEQFPGKKAFINQTIEQVRANIKTLIADMIHMSREHDKGDIDVMMDVAKFQGAFADIASGVNEMVNGHISVKKKAMACVAEFGKGNMEAPLEQFPGKKAFINQTIEQVRANIKALVVDTNMLVQSAVDGRLSTRADASKHQGDFAKIVQGVNDTLDSVIQPIIVLQKHLERVAVGDLTAFIEENYNGDHALLKNALNSSLDSLNEILGQVASSSQQVQIGAGELSSASQTVSQGSTESAASIEEISSSMAELSAQTKQNAENASVANQLASGARSTAEVGNKQMENMVSAMTEIEGASRNISKIIKVIDEIAFQTNLLALNAAVEAARAGVHGKGFAVVAEEVRNLAARSAKAAKETTEMIESTIAKVSNGSSIATETQRSLKEIVSAATRVSDLVSEINVASNEQAVGLQQVNQGISQLDAVTQQNSAAAEEAAASSEELNGQAEILIDAIGKFKLKGVQQAQFQRRSIAAQPRKAIPSHSQYQSSPTIKTLSANDIIDLDDPEFGKF